MLSVGLPITAVRQGRVADLTKIAVRILQKPGAAWLGRPISDVHQAIRGGRHDRWFVVAVDADDIPVAIVCYAAGPAARTPVVRVTSVACDPDLGDRTAVAVAALAVQETAGRFFRDVTASAVATQSRPSGYVIIDVGRENTEVADVLRASGWVCLQPRVGWPTDRFVKFLNWNPDNGQEEAAG